MKLWRGLPVLVWVLLGALAISAASLSLGSNDDAAFPSGSSHSPSGTLAFCDLLREQGYEVETTTSTSPVLGADDLIVGFTFGGFAMTFAEPAITKTFKRHFEAGGNALLLEVRQDFRTASLDAAKSTGDVTFADSGTGMKVNADESESPMSVLLKHSLAPDKAPSESPKSPGYDPMADGEIPLALYTSHNSESTFCGFVEIGKGKLVSTMQGIDATNRFIDKEDNAAALLAIVKTIHKPKGKIVFMDAVFGNSSKPGMVEMLGTWALPAWWQSILLFCLIVYTMGKPFGYPDEERARQGSSRDLVDAVAQTYQRSRATHVALRSVYADADQEVRRKLNLARDAEPRVRNSMIPEGLARSLVDVEAASENRIRPSDALGLVGKLRKELAEFLGELKVRRRREKRM